MGWSPPLAFLETAPLSFPVAGKSKCENVNEEAQKVNVKKVNVNKVNVKMLMKRHNGARQLTLWYT